MKAPLSHDGRGLSPAAPIMLPQRGLRQFILAEIGLRMSDPGQQRVMFRSDYGWASRFRHGAMLCRQRTSSLLYFVYILLELG